MLPHELFDLCGDDGISLVFIRWRWGIAFDGADIWWRENQLVAVKFQDLQTVHLPQAHGKLLDPILGDSEYLQRRKIGNLGGYGSDLVPADVEDLERGHFEDLVGISTLTYMQVCQGGEQRTTLGISRIAL